MPSHSHLEELEIVKVIVVLVAPRNIGGSCLPEFAHAEAQVRLHVLGMARIRRNSRQEVSLQQ